MWIYLKIFMVWQLLSPSGIYLSSSAVSMLRRLEGDIFEGPGYLEASLVPLGTFAFCESFWLKISISYKRLA